MTPATRPWEHLDAPRPPMTRSALGLGQLLVVLVALILITVGIVTANGTVWPALAAGAGITLLARLAWVATGGAR